MFTIDLIKLGILKFKNRLKVLGEWLKQNGDDQSAQKDLYFVDAYSNTKIVQLK